MRLLALLLDAMERKMSDFTMTFREMAEVSLEQLDKGDLPSEFW